MKFEIYCDESRPDLFTTKLRKSDQFLMIGGLWIPAEKREEIKSKLRELKQKHNMNSQIKWVKVSLNRLIFYKDLIDLFMSFGGYLRFRCIAVEIDNLNLIKYHSNDQELGFYKFYYQLIHHWIKDFNEYKIFTDIKTNRQKNRLQVLQRVLSNANLSSRITSVQALPSKEVVLIQLTDFLLGVISSKLNCSIKENGAKDQVIRYLEKKLGRILSSTNKSEQKYNIFKIDLEGGW